MFRHQQHMRMIWDIAAVLDPAVERHVLFLPMTAPDEMATLWRELGLLEVEQTSLAIRIEYSSFDDYWSPLTAGEAPPGQFIAGLPDATRATLTEQLRRAYLAGRADGPRSLACVALACRGMVPM
jgi:hypothetical protein